MDMGSLERARLTFGAENPTPENFQICGSHNCVKRIQVSLSPEEWRHVQAPFFSRPRTAGQERRALAESLRRIEVLVADKTGYESDSQNSAALAEKSQDCVDEMVNAAVYLEMLDNAGHLKFHKQGQRVTLGFMTRNLLSHTVSTIFERESGTEYIVETWAVPVGETPIIMNREDWAANEPFRHDY